MSGLTVPIALVLTILFTSQAQASRSACEQVISKSGFEPEKPYQFEEAGFFSWEKHIFGVFTCEINSDGTVRRVLRGQSVIAEDGAISRFVWVDWFPVMRGTHQML